MRGVSARVMQSGEKRGNQRRGRFLWAARAERDSHQHSPKEELSQTRTSSANVF